MIWCCMINLFLRPTLNLDQFRIKNKIKYNVNIGRLGAFPNFLGCWGGRKNPAHPPPGGRQRLPDLLLRERTHCFKSEQTCGRMEIVYESNNPYRINLDYRINIRGFATPQTLRVFFGRDKLFTLAAYMAMPPGFFFAWKRALV